MKKAIITIGLVGLVLGFVKTVSANTVEVNLFDLGCPTEFDHDLQYWTTSFDLGVTFIEITNVYMNWSGEITAGLAISNYENPDEPFPLDVAISSYFEFPIDAYTSIWGGQELYPEPEPFDCQSDFQLFGQRTWFDLLDEQATIWIYYETVIIGEGGYVESGHITLDRAYLVVDGVVPEPTTVLLLSLGISGIRAKLRKPNRK